MGTISGSKLADGGSELATHSPNALGSTQHQLHHSTVQLVTDQQAFEQTLRGQDTQHQNLSRTASSFTGTNNTMRLSMGQTQRRPAQEQHQRRPVGTKDKSQTVQWEPHYGQFNYNPLYNGLHSTVNSEPNDQVEGVKQFQVDEFLDEDYDDEDDEDGDDESMVVNGDELGEDENGRGRSRNTFRFDNDSHLASFETGQKQKQATNSQNHFSYTEDQVIQMGYFEEARYDQLNEQQSRTVATENNCRKRGQHLNQSMVSYQQTSSNGTLTMAGNGPLDCGQGNGGAGGLFVEYQQTNRNNLLNGNLVGGSGSSANAGVLEELHSLNITNCDSETIEEQIDHFVHEDGDLELISNLQQQQQQQQQQHQHLHNHHDDYQDFNLISATSDPFSFFANVNHYNNQQQQPSDSMHVSSDIGLSSTSALFQTSSSLAETQQTANCASRQAPLQDKVDKKRRKKRANETSQFQPETLGTSEKTHVKAQKGQVKATAQTKGRGQVKKTKATSTKDVRTKTDSAAGAYTKCSPSANGLRAASGGVATNKQAGKLSANCNKSKKSKVGEENKGHEELKQQQTQSAIPLRNTNKQLLPKKSTAFASTKSKPNPIKTTTRVKAANEVDSESILNQFSDLNGAPAYKQQLENLRKKLRMDIGPKVNVVQSCQTVTSQQTKSSRAAKSTAMASAPEQLSSSSKTFAGSMLLSRPLQGVHDNQTSQPSASSTYISISSAAISNSHQRPQAQQHQYQAYQQQQLARPAQTNSNSTGTIFLRTPSGGLIPVVSSTGTSQTVSSSTVSERGGAQLIGCLTNSMLLGGRNHQDQLINSTSDLNSQHQAQYHQLPIATTLAPANIIFQRQYQSSNVANSTQIAISNELAKVGLNSGSFPDKKQAPNESAGPQETHLVSSNCALIDHGSGSNSSVEASNNSSTAAAVDELLCMMEEDQQQQRKGSLPLGYIESEPLKEVCEGGVETSKVTTSAQAQQLIHMTGIELTSD